MHTLALALLLSQAPGDGWALAQVPPREVKTLYWEVFSSSETFVSLIPADSQGGPPRVRLIFQAFFDGKEPKGTPIRIVLRVFPLPLTVLKDYSLRLVLEKDTVDLGRGCVSPSGVGPPCQLLFPPNDESWNASGVLVDLEPALLRRFAAATSVTGVTLGFPITLSSEDRAAVARFAKAIHLGAASRK